KVPPHAKDAIWSALLLEGARLPAQRPSVFRRALRAGPAKGIIALSTILALGSAAVPTLRHALRPRAPNLAQTNVEMSAGPFLSATDAAAAGVAKTATTASATASAVAPEKERVATATGPHRGVMRTRDDDLGREVALLARARAELRVGEPRAALSTLAQMQSHPGHAFGQEREVLGILAQSAIGNKAAARQAAAGFVKAHPESPHAAELRPLLEQD
ncbi:MAG TPA: hypothetical protein VNW92_20990, partial [Polyangiaceae bacterium]|nr:hypothetical protein [Polyangiaceae bacterium]